MFIKLLVENRIYQVIKYEYAVYNSQGSQNGQLDFL